MKGNGLNQVLVYNNVDYRLRTNIWYKYDIYIFVEVV